MKYDVKATIEQKIAEIEQAIECDEHAIKGIHAKNTFRKGQIDALRQVVSGALFMASSASVAQKAIEPVLDKKAPALSLAIPSGLKTVDPYNVGDKVGLVDCPEHLKKKCRWKLGKVYTVYKVYRKDGEYLYSFWYNGRRWPHASLKLLQAKENKPVQEKPKVSQVGKRMGGKVRGAIEALKAMTVEGPIKSKVLTDYLGLKGKAAGSLVATFTKLAKHPNSVITQTPEGLFDYKRPLL